MSSVLRILHTTVIKNSLFYLFRFIEKNEKRISDCFVEQCSHIFVLFYVSDLTCIHDPCRSVPLLLAPNSGDAIDTWSVG